MEGIQCLQASLRLALTFVRAADLFHQAEQQTSRLVVEMQAIDEAARNANVSQFQTILRDTQLTQHIAGQLQNFGISSYSMTTEKLNTQLRVLTIATAPRSLVAEDWPGVLKA